ncbi:MAG TPA: hypothetical protein VF677_03795 [Flavobacterium sp.]|jgi:hypothetical protein
MNDKKNLDRFFQEKFKDFESEPKEHIWENIELVLKEEKKETRIIPIWWRLSGIAATLILGFFVLDLIFIDKNNIEKNTIIKENTILENDRSVQETDSVSDVLVNKDSTIKNNGIVTTTIAPENEENENTRTNPVSKDNKTRDKKQVNSRKHTGLPEVIHHSQNVPVADAKENKNGKNNDVITAKTALGINKNKVITEKNLNTKKEKFKNFSKNKPLSHPDNDALVNTVSGEDVLQNQAENIKKPQAKQHSIIEKINVHDNTITINQKKTDVDNKHSNEVKKNNVAEINRDNKNLIAVPKAFADKKKKLDSTTGVTVSNALEELLKKNEKEKENKNAVKTKSNRWQLTSSVAPIYFSSVANGSSIDAQFNDNRKTYEDHLSLGVGVKYAVSEKIKIRTGINTFKLGYNTNDVVFYAGLNSKNLKNISNSPAAAAIEVRSLDAYKKLLPAENTVQGMGTNLGIMNINEGVMNQRMSYFEVPLEMSYAILDKQFGLDLIGGVSTLFLNDNSVSVISPTISANLGKANNLNAVHFSTNLGIGFKYRLWKSFEANFEPTFKYQINTFSDDVGGFKPYFIGLYSGLSFKF